MLLISVTSAETAVATAAAGTEERKRCDIDMTMNNDLSMDKDACSIGSRNTADAVTSVSRNESKNREQNRPTVSSNIGEKNIGSLGVNTTDAAMLSNSSKPNKNN